MANIEKNLVNTAKLARRISNSKWRSMMERIVGSREETFPLAPELTEAGTPEFAAAGMSPFMSLVALIVLLFVLIGLILLTWRMVSRPPSAATAPRFNDVIRNAPDDGTPGDLSSAVLQEQQEAPRQPVSRTQRDKEIMERGGAYPGMMPDNRPSLVPDQQYDGTPDDPGLSNAVSDAALQVQRLQAIQNGDTKVYNSLVQQHRDQIQKSGRDPGSSGFFPQGQSTSK